MAGKIIGYQRDHSDQPCEFCGLEDTPEGHDGCIGTLPNVMNACCGHGTTMFAYVQFSPDSRIAGQEALDYIKGNGLPCQSMPPVALKTEMEIKTPDEWLEDPEFAGIEIMDPDGWDRKNFAESWATPISKAEFGQRLQQCTMKFPTGYFERNRIALRAEEKADASATG